MPTLWTDGGECVELGVQDYVPAIAAPAMLAPVQEGGSSSSGSGKGDGAKAAAPEAAGNRVHYASQPEAPSPGPKKKEGLDPNQCLAHVQRTHDATVATRARSNAPHHRRKTREEGEAAPEGVADEVFGELSTADHIVLASERTCSRHGGTAA